MLVSLGHGKVGVLGATQSFVAQVSEEFEPLDVGTLSEVAASMPMHAFAYFFKGPGLPEDPDAFDKLGQLGEAMISDSGQLIGPSGLPAILTYFGQFIDHDITLHTDTDPDRLPDFAIGKEEGDLVLNDRKEVLRCIKNGRIPTLNLDSVYGDETDLDEKLRDGARMIIGETIGGRPNDLPRFAQVGSGMIDNGKIFPSSAFIGDGRNDENLIIAQLHLAFLRFHNAVVDWLDEHEPELDEEARFERARDITTLHYQWLVAHVYLPAICDEDTLEGVRIDGGKLYDALLDKGGQPMPLEFSVAGFRFGHSMIRHEYRFNDDFPDATLKQLFLFTGGKPPTNLSNNKLPDIWVIDWNNFLDGDDRDLAARPTDSALSEGLDELIRNPDVLKNLPVRNLRRSYVLNIPTAQSALAELGQVEPLSDSDLLSFADGLIGTLGYLEDTPLWLYLLIEAETRGDGKRLGPLGTTIVAETLLGLLRHDPKSFVHRGGGKSGEWSPSQFQLADKPIDSLDKFLRFAGVLEGEDQ